MNIPVLYNGTSLDVTVEDDRVAGVIGPNPTAVKNEREVLLNALSHPLESELLEGFLAGGRRVLVIVNDNDRNTPTANVLDAISGLLPAGQIRFLVATGSHPPPCERELRSLFGNHYPTHRGCIALHNARDASGTILFGSTRRGTDVRLNRAFSEADRVVVIGSVEPHYFAGFTGGRKAFLPGIAAYASIEQNHRLALEDGVRVLALEGNPLHEDLEESFALIESKPIFSIQTVLDAENRLHFVSAGDLRKTFRAAVNRAMDVYCVRVPGKADVVVAVAAPPLDATLYQSHKAVENVRSVLNDDGIVIWVAGCSNGLGNDSFVNLLKSAERPQDVFDRIRRGYRLGYHKAAKIADLLKRVRIWAVTDLAPDVLQSIFLRPFASLQTAVDCALNEKKNGKALFVHSATTTVPVVTDRA